MGQKTHNVGTRGARVDKRAALNTSRRTTRVHDVCTLARGWANGRPRGLVIERSIASDVVGAGARGRRIHIVHR